MKENQNTHQMVSSAQKGDRFALEQLCNIYAERIRRIVRLRAGTELRAQLESMDLVQDAMIAAVTSLKDFRYHKDGDFMRWLAKIAENRIRDRVDHIHAAKRDVRRQVQLEDDENKSSCQKPYGSVPIVTTTPSVLLVKREEFDRLEKAMDRLKGHYRKVLLLAKIEGLTHEQIAERMKKSPAAVAKLLPRAIVALANEFENS
ncbi:MAG: RNA polymerase sigma factor [Sedimentisphaerales bacterium]|nr:RNA polymerase sigma factor [Sedimentisphaerales bacterium]